MVKKQLINMLLTRESLQIKRHIQFERKAREAKRGKLGRGVAGRMRVWLSGAAGAGAGRAAGVGGGWKAPRGGGLGERAVPWGGD